MKKRKQHICTNEYIVKKIGHGSLFVILPKKQMNQHGIDEGNSIILEAYKWVDE